MSVDIKMASPLGADAPVKAEGRGLTLVERRDVGMLLVRGKRENAAFVAWLQNLLGAEPPQDRISVSAGDFSIVRMGRIDYLVSGEVTAVAALARKAETAAEGAPCIAAEITHGRIIVDMEGAGAVTVLSKSCGLDTRLAGFPVGLGTRTRFADMLVYVERQGETRFRLVSDRATGALFWSWLEDAGAEFLCGVTSALKLRHDA